MWKCQELRQDAHIPDLYFRRRGPCYAAQWRYWPRWKRFALEDCYYEQAADRYLCPHGNRLRRQVKQICREGMVHRIYAAGEMDCRCCPLQLRCITNKGGKREYFRVPIGVELANLSKRTAGKVDSGLGRQIYRQRVAVAEPVFANIRTHKGLDRFPLGGRLKVTIQWLRYCMVDNIEKITN